MTLTCRNWLALLAIVLPIGCGNGSSDNTSDLQTDVRPVKNQVEAKESLESRVARLLSSSEAIGASHGPSAFDTESEEGVSIKEYWEFTADNVSGPVLQLPPVVCLPPATTPSPQPYQESKSSVASENIPGDTSLGSLLPPQPLDARDMQQGVFSFESRSPRSGETAKKVVDSLRSDEQSSTNCTQGVARFEPTPSPSSADAEDLLVDAVIRESSPAATGVLTSERMDELSKAKIRRAYALANRAAHYAARQELIEVLRMISHAKDAQLGAPDRTIALAAGLRALREANDFAPRGTQLEAELAIDVICASHRTPVARRGESSGVLPHEMLDRYLRYAQIKLGSAVAGERAGSMALHALGKLTSQLGIVEPDRHRLTQRRAIAYQQAALLAHSQNHLAAHELAVLLADSGHYADAEKLLQQVAVREPNAVVLRNLAEVQKKLGLPLDATANFDLARQLSQQGASGIHNVQWVSPESFARSSVSTQAVSTTMTRTPISQPNATARRNLPSQSNLRY